MVRSSGRLSVGTGQTGTHCAATGVGWSKVVAVWRLIKFPDEDQSREKLETSSWLSKRTQETNGKLCKLKPDYCDSEELYKEFHLTSKTRASSRPKFMELNVRVKENF